MGLSRALRAMGHEARVLGPCDGPPPASFVTALGVSIPTSANGSVAPIAPDPSCVLRTIRALRDEQYDIVHLHEPLVPGPTLTALLFTELPTIGTFHRAGQSHAYMLLRPWVKWVAKRLQLRCAVSEDARATATRALGGRYELLFNGIEVDRFAKGEATPTDGPTIFFVGRHEPRKGLAVLLEAMAYLGPDVRLWIAGDGPQTSELRARAAGDPRVTWLGRISETEKAERLRGADVFCAPSLGGESFGVVLLEAMASGTPIVASDLPGYRNVARPGLDALLVPPGDGGQLAAALRRVLDSPSFADELVSSGTARADSFSMDSLAQRYVESYERLAPGA
jgi:phosphatidylinositol alpha-mannosyltransferase